ncbi:hypothetical protein [Nocardia sp. NPDC023988]|uniref:hypothetical protein n=1 Tax=unclassified Nocardia TaxID=2637762 RepID=UPI0033C1EDDD
MPPPIDRAAHASAGIWNAYARRGTTTLLAAFNTADGTAIGELHRRHRTTEFRKS